MLEKVYKYKTGIWREFIGIRLTFGENGAIFKISLQIIG